MPCKPRLSPRTCNINLHFLPRPSTLAERGGQRLSPVDCLSYSQFNQSGSLTLSSPLFLSLTLSRPNILSSSHLLPTSFPSSLFVSHTSYLLPSLSPPPPHFPLIHSLTHTQHAATGNIPRPHSSLPAPTRLEDQTVF